MTRNPVYKKHFTAAEANKMLPLVKMIVQDIASHYQEVVERKERIDAMTKRQRRKQGPALAVYDEELEQAEIELSADLEKLEGYADELRKLGVQLKDPTIGLIDFPAFLDGREVFLCWKLGEAEIAHWHELNAGFSGRQSLLESISTDQNDLPAQNDRL